MHRNTRFALALGLALASFGPRSAPASAQAPITVASPVPLDVVAAPALPSPSRRQIEAHAASSGATRLVVFRDVPDPTTSTPDETLVAVRIRASDGAILGGTRIPLTVAAFAEVTFGVGASADTFLVVFSDDQRSVKGLRIRASDGAVLDGAPFVVSAYDGSRPEDYSIASDGSKFLVVWTDWRNPSLTQTGSNPDVFMNLVTSSGSVSDATGKVFANGLDHQYSPHVVWDGSAYVVVFGQAPAGSTYHLRARRVSAAGGLTGSVVDVGTPSTYRFDGDLAFGDGRFAFVHAPGAPGASNVVTILLLDGNLAPIGSPLTVASVGDAVAGPQVAWNGRGFLATWYTSAGSVPTEVQPWAVRFTSAGTLVDTARVPLGSSLAFPDATAWNDPVFAAGLVALTDARWLIAHPYFDGDPAIASRRVGARIVEASFPVTTPVDAGTGGGGGGGGGGGAIVCSASPAFGHGSRGSVVLLLLGVMVLVRVRRRGERGVNGVHHPDRAHREPGPRHRS
ncbi:MAG: hypothetical protein U0230_27515 [Polyangiales bacterium]